MNHEEEEMVPGDAEDMAEALGEISEALGCLNTKDDILHAIDALAKDSARWKWYVEAMIDEDGDKRQALFQQPFPKFTHAAWEKCIDAAMLVAPMEEQQA